VVKLAIIANAPSPYRIHQHLRIVRELPEVELSSVFLHEHNWQPWTTSLPQEIRPVVFGPGESARRMKRPSAWLHQWRKAGRVIRWLREQRVDAVIITGYNDPGLARLIAWCARAELPSFLFGDSNVFGDRAGGWRRSLKTRYLQWVLRHVAGVMPCGLYGRQYFAQYGGADKPWFYMPHEPDYGRIFSVSPAARAAAQSKFNLQLGRKYFVYSGRLAPVKRVDTLIDAFARIAGQRPDWDLLIIGGGELEAELKARVPTGLASRTVWTGFINDPDELASLYRCGHVFVLPSSYEPWAVVVCEAAAAGMPLVASRVVGAAAELCRDGYNARLFTPGDVDELGRALLEVTASDETLESMSRRSLEVLDDWRRRGDPVQGVRQALAHVGLLEAPGPIAPDPPTPLVVAAYT
jgi:glycosyltransferase involved in cell wall biosynthesis